MAAKEISEIVSDLMKVGALIPEKEWSEDCVDPAMMLFDSIAESRTLAHAFLSSPSEDVVNWDIARIDGQKQLINSLAGEKFILPGTKDMLEADLSGAIEALKRKDYLRAASSIQAFGNNVERYLPQWISQCACVKKGDIISGIYYGINIQSVGIGSQVSQTAKNIIWQDQIAALNRNGILTAEEADRLIKEVRW